MTLHNGSWRCLALLALFGAGSAFSAGPPSKKNYSDIFRDFYDLATPHNRGDDYSGGLEARFSTAIPLSRLASTTKPSNGVVTSSTYSSFFNFQAKGFFRFLYHYEAFLLSGYNSIDLDFPVRQGSYQHASYSAFPLLFGVKYRILRGDIVPYISAAGGIYFLTVSATEEGTPSANPSVSKNALGYQVVGGMEIFIDSHFGLCVEVGLEQIHHGAITLGSEFQDGPITTKSVSGGLLLVSSFFYEF